MSQADVAVQEKIKIKEPGLYKVIFVNDEKTSFDFVICVLMGVFHHSYESAVAVTQSIHNSSAGTVGTYTFEVAEQKRAVTLGLAQQNGFSLFTVTVEPE